MQTFITIYISIGILCAIFAIIDAQKNYKGMGGVSNVKLIMSGLILIFTLPTVLIVSAIRNLLKKLG